jgi:hypothetical protein
VHAFDPYLPQGRGSGPEATSVVLQCTACSGRLLRVARYLA